MSDPCARLTRAALVRMFPDWERKVAEAEAAGTETCSACGFTYYRTTTCCPLCNGRGPDPRLAALLEQDANHAE